MFKSNINPSLMPSLSMAIAICLSVLIFSCTEDEIKPVVDEPDSYEENDSKSEAYLLGESVADIVLSIVPNDDDWYAIEIQKDSITIELNLLNEGSQIEFELLNEEDEVIENNFVDNDHLLISSLIDPGKYYLHLYSTVNSVQSYTISWTSGWSINHYTRIPLSNISSIADMWIMNSYPDFLLPQDDKSVWLISPYLNRVDLFTPESSGELIYGIDISPASPMGRMVMAFGSLWVATNKSTLLRIDPTTKSVIAEIDVQMIDYESTLAAEGGYIWVLTSTPGELAYINPNTNLKEGIINVRENSFGLTSGFGSVWVSNKGTYDETGNGSMQRVDPITKQIIATIAVGKQPHFSTSGALGVWVTNQGDGTVSRIDPVTNTEISRIDLGITGVGGDICFGEGKIWVRAVNTLLTVINESDNQILKRYGPKHDSGAVIVNSGFVWVSDFVSKKIWRFPV